MGTVSKCSVIAATTLVLFVGVCAFAQEPGNTVTVLFPASGNQPELGDKLIFTGGPLTTIDITNQCGAGSYPMQNAVLVDPGAQRGSGPVTVITVSQFNPVPPGTRGVNFSFDARCSVGGIEYNRYNVIVD